MESKPTAIPRAGSHQHLHAAQTVVEFALVSLVLFALIFGIIDFSRAITTRVMVTNAVREALRVGVVAPSNTTAMIDAATARSPMLGSFTLTRTCSTWGASATPTSLAVAPVTRTCNPVSATEVNGYQSLDRLEVCITYNFDLLVTGMLRIGGTIPMSECGRGVIQ